MWDTIGKKASTYVVMVESIVSAVLAVVTGGFVLTSRINSKIDSVDKRIDEVELCTLIYI